MAVNKRQNYFKLLSDEEIKKIHWSTLDVLENTGVKFSLDEAKNIFRDIGLKVDKNDIVYFPSHIVEDAIRKTPAQFTRYPLNPKFEPIRMGENYLEHDHTLKYFREEQYTPVLADRNRYEIWEKNGAKDMRQRAKEKAIKILDEHHPNHLSESIKKELEKMVKAICKREGIEYIPIP